MAFSIKPPQNLQHYTDTTPQTLTTELYTGSVRKLQAVADGLYLVSGNDELEAVQYGEESASNFAEVVAKIRSKEIVDFIIIDCNPQITNLTMAGIMAADSLLIPLQPSRYSVDGLRKLFQEVKKMRATGASRARILGFVMNMVSGTKLHRQTVRQLRERYPEYVFDAVIHKRTAYEESPIKSQNIWDYGQDEKAELEMSALVKEFMRKIEV